MSEGKKLEGKNAVITGGTTGLGFETAKQYLAEGAKVLITGRTQEKVDAAVAELGEGAYGVAAAASQISEINVLATFAKETFGHVDILFANAGNGVFSPIEEIDEQAYDHQFDLNVKGVFFTVQKILPLIREGGSIILTASAVHEKGVPNGSIYFASKAAVRSFARSLGAELGPRNIRVNTLSPGLVPTKFFSNSNVGSEAYGGFEEMIRSSAPLARPGTAKDMANAALFLAANDSSYMTSADLVVDGGWMNV